MNPQNLEDDSLTLEDRFVFLFKFVWKEKIIIFFTYFLAIIIATVYLNIVPKQYKSSLSGFSNYLKANQVKIVVADLQLLLNSKKTNLVAKELGMKNAQVLKVKNIEVLDQSEVYKKLIDDNLNFQINVVVSDVKILDSLEEGLKRYLSNNTYVKKKIMLDKLDLIEEKNVVNSEIEYIDRAKGLMLNKISNNENKGFIVSDLGEIITTKIELHNKMKLYEDKLRFVEGFQVIKSFDKSYNKCFPKGSYVLALSLAIATISLYIFFFSKKAFHNSNR